MKNTGEHRRSGKTVEANEDDPRLLAAVREYQAALESGRRPNRNEFLARHADIAAELAECLEGIDLMQSAAPRLGGQDVSPVPVAPNGTLGDFRLLRELGRGGMGVVYEAEQLSLGRRVALKVLPFAATLDPRQKQRFENEARAAAQLHHPNVVPVHAVGCERGVHYYAMQLIDGRTLAEVIDQLRRSPKPPAPVADTEANAASVTQQSVNSRAFFRTVARLGVQAAEALDYAHQMGVVHRDVKPANLMLDGRGNLWVTDFGLARFQTAPHLTAPGDLVGTARYMSPEQAAGSPVIDPRSDIYCLGATLYELLTQHPVVDGRDRRECLRQIFDEEPPPLRRFNPALPPELEIIVRKALAKLPEERYGSASELADDLRRFLDDQPIRARKPTLRTLAVKWLRRHRRLVTAGVVLLAASVLVLAATAWRIWQAETETLAAYEELKKEQARTHEEHEETQAALRREAAQRRRAEDNYLDARRLLAFLTQLGVEELADRPETQQLRRRLLTEVLAYHQDLIDRYGDNPEVTAELVETQFVVAELLDKLGQKAESLAAVERGERLRQQLDGPKPDYTLPRGIAAFVLIAKPGVQEELKLSREQKEKIIALFDPRRKPTGEGFATAETSLSDILKPEQALRLRQLVLQARGPLALLDPETSKELELTETQKNKIRSLVARDMEHPGPVGPVSPISTGGREPKMEGPFRRPAPGGRPGIGIHGGREGRDGREGQGRREGSGGPTGGRPPEPEPRRINVNDEILGVLTTAQHSHWQKMLGEPFRGELRLGLQGH
jgi:serine/threonine protein kinase